MNKSKLCKKYLELATITIVLIFSINLVISLKNNTHWAMAMKVFRRQWKLIKYVNHLEKTVTMMNLKTDSTCRVSSLSNSRALPATVYRMLGT